MLGETPVRGLISTSAPKQGLGERIGKGIVGAVTFTRETDLGHYYFVAADDGLHLLGFDGERCFLNEVYAAGEIRRARLEPRTFSFDYKGGTVRMEVPNGGLAEGYPRFRIHEYDKVPTSSDRATNYFVREYFACEPTGNLAGRQAQGAVPRFTGPNVWRRRLIDRKVRTAPPRDSGGNWASSDPFPAACGGRGPEANGPSALFPRPARSIRARAAS